MVQPLLLRINIARDDLRYLEENNLNLCLSRDLEFEGAFTPGNVVFSGLLSKDLGPRIGLQWQEEYQLYGTKFFRAGTKVMVDTDTRNIEGGQQATFKKDGTTSLSGFPKPDAPFMAKNQWMHPARVGVNNYDAVSDTFTSFFVSSEVPIDSTSRVLPLQSYFVFWNAKLETDFMFQQEDASNRFGFTLTKEDPEIVLAYTGGMWAITK